MSNSIETAIAIAKKTPKLLLITSYFYLEVSASKTGLEGYKKGSMWSKIVKCLFESIVKYSLR